MTEATTEHEAALAPLYDELLDALGVDEDARYLEAGCRAGYACQLAAERGAEVSGFDTYVPLLEVALDRVPTGDFRVGTLERAPFAPRQHTHVAAFCSLHRAVDARAAVRVLQLLGARDATLAVAVLDGRPLPGGEEVALAALLRTEGLDVLATGEHAVELRYADEDAARDDLERAGWLSADAGAVPLVRNGRGLIVRERLSYAVARGRR